ncbi:RusA family crossover junction endodeoxyribonuclease [Clostridium tetani]|nr:RusA family crossover junction endodeoxyribonuclease [Clostridium tetani]AVP54557.1 RusA family crossover junction endodeoxyribonuclease [Clostridium tetani]KGI36835.1 Zn-finger containing protein [Clostridium tetani ATCC 9441]KGI38588.1 Zn-finger containing protein [Clostridium tetani]KGI44169.1 Zn-finger containing protein [Clostridium tetani]KHO30907.1 Zn-finger containing protein [Clostridium tetani]
MNNYAKIIVKGSPITKSNFKLFNLQGRAILPHNSGKYHDRYAVYEQEIAYEARVQNPNIILSESLIAVLKVYYKSKKRHPDTINITKSIFDGVEKSGVIINDAQIRRIIVEEFYDKENPRFELELFGESFYSMDYTIKKRDINVKPIEYNPSPNTHNKSPEKIDKKVIGENLCSICGKKVTITDCFSANKGTMKICKECFKKSF